MEENVTIKRYCRTLIIFDKNLINTQGAYVSINELDIASLVGSYEAPVINELCFGFLLTRTEAL
jgi:hypothetical protein